MNRYQIRWLDGTSQEVEAPSRAQAGIQARSNPDDPRRRTMTILDVQCLAWGAPDPTAAATATR